MPVSAPDTADERAMLRELLDRVRRIEAVVVASRRTRIRQGRPPTDDADALAEIADLMKRGIDRTEAIGRVARTLSGNVEAHQQRLGRKLRD